MGQPLDKIRAGSVSAAIWENEATVNGKTITMLKASVERRFKDTNGTWKSSSSFSRNEIPLAIFCLARAFGKIIREEKDNGPVPEEEVR